MQSPQFRKVPIFMFFSVRILLGSFPLAKWESRFSESFLAFLQYLCLSWELWSLSKYFISQLSFVKYFCLDMILFWVTTASQFCFKSTEYFVFHEICKKTSLVFWQQPGFFAWYSVIPKYCWVFLYLYKSK